MAAPDSARSQLRGHHHVSSCTQERRHTHGLRSAGHALPEAHQDHGPHAAGFVGPSTPLLGGLELRGRPGHAAQLLESSVVFSKVFLQPTVAVSSCEAELNGFFEAALWLEFFRRIAAFMGITQHGPTTVYADSASAIALLKKRVPSGRSKHYDVRYFRINESIDRGEIALQWISTQLMPADIGTKPLPRPRFTELAGPLLDVRLDGVLAPLRLDDPAPSRRCVHSSRFEQSTQESPLRPVTHAVRTT